jgi:hypothetical protein
MVAASWFGVRIGVRPRRRERGTTDIKNPRLIVVGTEVRRKWQAHVAKVRANIEKKKAEHDAKEAERFAKMALAYALDAIDFAQAAIDQAEYAALDALYAQAAADSRVS